METTYTETVTDYKLLTILLSIVAVLAVADPNRPRSVVLFALALVLGVTGVRARIDVGQEGVRVAMGLGWPRFWVPASDIEGVSVGSVSGFIGAGLRPTKDAIQVLIRPGSVLRIERRGRRALVLTLPDAVDASAAIRSLR